MGCNLPRLADLQGQFARAILNPEAVVPAQIIGPDRLQSPHRFGVYRNNVVVGLIEALEASYPITCKIVGDEFFRAMARSFALGHPPQSPVMLDYGKGFAEFIEAFTPAESLPYLADVARLERAWTEAYHAKDAIPLTGQDLARIEQGSLPQLILTLHPSVRFLASGYPVLSIWKMNMDNVPAPIDLEAAGEEILICRPDLEVNVYPIPVATVAFLNRLSKGVTLEKAAEAGWAVNPGFDLTRSLAGLIECGALAGWKLPDTGHHNCTGELLP